MDETMKAVGVYQYLPIDEPKSLVDISLTKPTASGHDLLIKIKAISVNPVDTKQRAAKERKGKEARTLGWDAAGIITAAGEKVTSFKTGDEVFYAGSVNRPGCYSEYQLVDERLVAKKPKTLNFIQAASLPLTSLTASEALFERLDISHNLSSNASHKILIINGAGGVGSIAVQLAKSVELTVIATASRKETTTWVKELGADFVINHRQSFRPQLEKLGIKEVDYILCLHSTDQHWSDMADVIAPLGKICSIVENQRPVELGLLKDKSVTFAWEFMFAKAKYQTADMYTQGELLSAVATLADKGAIRPTMKHNFGKITAENLRKAHKQLETDTTIGKIVLSGFLE
ncbi:MAG TPA: zinc-binding alcohol dehydrogenase family protein [Tetragenococcus sp.]|nr:zinc-binding alcohol dehydrogenase family protein [Tetragenococcus sp.]